MAHPVEVKLYLFYLFFINLNLPHTSKLTHNEDKNLPLKTPVAGERLTVGRANFTQVISSFHVAIIICPTYVEE